MIGRVKSIIRESFHGAILLEIIAIQVYIERKIINRCRYFGYKYKCPVCKSNLRSFLPLPAKFTGTFEFSGVKYSKDDWETLNYRNYRCPVCFSNDRSRFIALYLKTVLYGQHSKNFNNESNNTDNQKPILLHFSPEKGLFRFIRKTNRFKYMPSDSCIMSETNRFKYKTPDYCKKGISLKLDLQKMDVIKDNCVDSFICSHVLEHIKEDKKALSELYRVLKVDGWGIVLVPINEKLEYTYEDPAIISEEDRIKHFGKKDHFRVYAKKDFINRLKDAGFKIKELGADNFFEKEVLKKSGITEKSKLYVLNKLTV